LSRTVKTFRVAEDEEPAEPISFVFEFMPVDPEAEPLVEKFEAYGKAPGGALLSAMAINRVDRRGNSQPSMEELRNFFRISMPPGDAERLLNLFDDPAWTIEFKQITDVFTWLLEEQSARPTKPSLRSLRTRQDDGRTEHGAVIELPSDSVAETS